MAGWDIVKRVVATGLALLPVGGQKVLTQVFQELRNPEQEAEVEVIPGDHHEEPAKSALVAYAVPCRTSEPKPTQAPTLIQNISQQNSSGLVTALHADYELYERLAPSTPPIASTYVPKPDSVSHVANLAAMTGDTLPLGYIAPSDKIPSQQINQIDYAELHKQNPITLTEQAWELYDTYIDSEDLPEKEFTNERDAFAQEVAKWFADFTIGSLASGIVSSLAYDTFKAVIKNRREKSKERISKYYGYMDDEYQSVSSFLKKSEKDGNLIRVTEIAQETGLSKERVRTWLKTFHFTHYSNCNWQRPYIYKVAT